jgi:hypothetical protein
MFKPLSYFLVFLAIVLVSCKRHKEVVASTPGPTPPPPAQIPSNPVVPNDMQVIISEEMLNKCFTAIGPISGKEAYQILFVNDSFSWTLINPKIHLHPAKADFTTDVKVVAGMFAYTTSCLGDVNIWYDRPKNLINVKITKCMVEIYTRFMGTKYHIKDIDLADQFTEPFTFEGPTATNTEMPVEMPDGTTKTLYMRTTDCDLSVQEKQIVVPCEVEFTTVPPPPYQPKR